MGASLVVLHAIRVDVWRWFEQRKAECGAPCTGSCARRLSCESSNHLQQNCIVAFRLAQCRMSAIASSSGTCKTTCHIGVHFAECMQDVHAHFAAKFQSGEPTRILVTMSKMLLEFAKAAQKIQVMHTCIACA